MGIQFRKAEEADVPEMARIRASSRGTVPYWNERILAYLHGDLHPKEALPSRIAFLAEMSGGTIAGLIAGHLTRRFGCEGELEWIDVVAEYRRQGIASGLLRQLAGWFVFEKGFRICVDVDPANLSARKFYRHHGAVELNKYWMLWEDISIVLKAPPR